MGTRPMPGRKAEAARNDTGIRQAAREVFMGDPGAPMSSVAQAAGVGIGALYRRYASKEELLRTICADGLRRFAEIAEAALADRDDPWRAFAGFLTGVIDSDVHSLTIRLAGTFSPTEELHRQAAEANALVERLFRRTKRAGAIRADLHVRDLPMLFEQVAAIRVPDADRTRELRRRFLALHLDGIRHPTGVLPGKPLTDAELGVRWEASGPVAG